MSEEKPEMRTVEGFRGPQFNIGRCVVCGEDVWVYADQSVPNPIVHKRPCKELQEVV